MSKIRSTILKSATAAVLAVGLSVGAASAAFAVTRSYGPFPNAGSCNYERSAVLAANPGSTATSCGRNLGASWFFTAYNVS